MKQALNITLGMGMLWLSAGYAEAQQVELLKPKELGRKYMSCKAVPGG